jgi:hypothetical protein
VTTRGFVARACLILAVTLVLVGETVDWSRQYVGFGPGLGERVIDGITMPTIGVPLALVALHLLVVVMRGKRHTMLPGIALFALAILVSLAASPDASIKAAAGPGLGCIWGATVLGGIGLALMVRTPRESLASDLASNIAPRSTRAGHLGI